MNDSATAAEATVRIRKVAIFIPGNTSMVKMEPKYCLRLYQALWKGHIPDPMDPIRLIPIPQGLPADLRWRELPAEDACEYEAARLRNEFGLHAKSGEPLFDVVYPFDTFEAVFAKAVEDSAVADDTKATPGIVDELAKLPGVGTVLAMKLVGSGLDSVQKVAYVDLAELAKIVGKNRAIKAQEAAIALLEPTKSEPTASPT